MTENIQPSEGFLQSTLDALSTHIAILDEHGCIVAVNQSWTNFSIQNGGSPESTGAGVDYLAICDAATGDYAEDARKVANGIRKILSRELESTELIYSLPLQNRLRWFHVRMTGFDEDSKRRIVVAHEDVTDRVETEQALRSSEERLRLSTMATNDAIWDWNLIDDTIQWNEGFSTIFGYGEDEREHPGKFWKDNVHPDDWDQVISDIYRTFESQDNLWNAEYRFKRKSGDYANIWDGGFVIRNEKGTAVRMVGAMADLSERKRFEEQLRQSDERFNLVVKGSGAGIWDLDLVSGNHYFSPRCMELLGYTPETAAALGPLTIERFGDFLHPDDKEGIMEALLAHLEGFAPYKIECRLQLKDGTYRWFEASGEALRDKNGRAYRVAGSILDITERRTAEAERDRLERQLRQAQRMEALGTLGGGIAHDFNNILGTIMGYCELALGDVDSKKSLAEDLQQIMKASYRGKELVQQILAFSRHEETATETICLQEVLNDVLNLVRISLPRSIELVKVLPEDPLFIEGNATQIHQILLNLANNSAQAMQGEPGRISLSLSECITSCEDPLCREQHYENRRCCQLRFSDTGCGINAEHLERIFDPFFTTKPPGKGTGLGLSVADGIVRRHGGTISVNSAPGRGTEFTIHLPLVDAPCPRQGTSASPVPLGNGQRILLVDDEEALATGMKRALERAGYSIVLETSSIEALKHFNESPDGFDLVVTDQNMPGLNVDALARAVLEIRPNLPIVLITGYSSTIDPAGAKSLGICEFCYKPVTMDELVLVIQRCIAPVGA